MTKQLLIYTKAVPISAARHRDWSVKAGEDYGFARTLNAAPLMAAEFAAAAATLPIVFGGTAEKAMPTAIMGVRAKENLFVDAAGAWGPAYKPAFLRQYPFAFAAAKGEERLALCLDESFAGCNTEGRGERLFDSEGARTGYLEAMLTFAQKYQAQVRLTEAFCAKLVAFDLLEPMQANFKGPKGEPAQLSGFQAVSREKLKALPPEQLKDLMTSDALELIYVHLGSMRHFQSLIGRLADAAPASQLEANATTPSDDAPPPAQ